MTLPKDPIPIIPSSGSSTSPLPVIIKESVNVNQVNRKDLVQSGNVSIVPDFEIDIYGEIQKLDIQKREDLYLKSQANGLLRKLQRFNNLKQKLGS